jgi:hypothetical protein
MVIGRQPSGETVEPVARSRYGFIGQRALHRGHEPRVHTHEFQTRPRRFSGVRGAGSWVVMILRAFVHSGSRALWRLPVAAAPRK